MSNITNVQLDFDKVVDATLSWKDLWEANKKFAKQKLVIFLPDIITVNGVECNAMTMLKLESGQTVAVYVHYDSSDGSLSFVLPKCLQKQFAFGEIN